MLISNIYHFSQGMLHGVRPRPPSLNSGGPPARPPPPSHQQWPRTDEHRQQRDRELFFFLKIVLSFVLSGS